MSGELSRRSVLVGGASLVGVASAGALVPRAVGALAAVPSRNLALRRSAFLPLVGQRFQIVHDGGALNVVLRQVDDLTPSLRPGAEHQFSLIFTEAGLQPILPQETYSISHARQGQISLFIVPVGPRRSAQHYQAIINTRPLSAIS